MRATTLDDIQASVPEIVDEDSSSTTNVNVSRIYQYNDPQLTEALVSVMYRMYYAKTASVSNFFSFV